MGPETRLIISCEHAGNTVPDAYRHLFYEYDDLLQTHRGWDIGALDLAELLAQDCSATLFSHKVTRLLVDVHRSLYRRTLFSEITKSQDKTVRQAILEAYYYPYRNTLEHAVRSAIEKGCRVVHISQHSFTPVLKGQERHCDVGLLYDPGRRWEKPFAMAWKKLLLQHNPSLRVRYNYPYRGKPDGLPACFRRLFDDEHYIGFELEINQKIPLASDSSWPHLMEIISQSLQKTIGNIFPT